MELQIQSVKSQMQQFITEAEGVLQQVATSLNWKETHRDQSTDVKFSFCPINKAHRVPEAKVNQHIEKCQLKSLGYSNEDIFLEEIEPHLKNHPSVVKIDKYKQKQIFIEALKRNGNLNISTHLRDPPLTYDRYLYEYTADERYTLYDYAIQQTTSQQSGRIFADTLAIGSDTQGVEKRAKDPQTLKDLLAAERDAKRRRQAYRKKNPETTGLKSDTESLRELIQSQMEFFYNSRPDRTARDTKAEEAPVQWRYGRRLNVHNYHRQWEVMGDDSKYEDFTARQRAEQRWEEDGSRHKSEREEYDNRSSSRQRAEQRWEEDGSRHKSEREEYDNRSSSRQRAEQRWEEDGSRHKSEREDYDNRSSSRQRAEQRWEEDGSRHKSEREEYDNRSSSRQRAEQRWEEDGSRHKSEREEYDNRSSSRQRAEQRWEEDGSRHKSEREEYDNRSSSRHRHERKHSKDEKYRPRAEKSNTKREEYGTSSRSTYKYEKRERKQSRDRGNTSRHEGNERPSDRDEDKNQFTSDRENKSSDKYSRSHRHERRKSSRSPQSSQLYDRSYRRSKSPRKHKPGDRKDYVHGRVDRRSCERKNRSRSHSKDNKREKSTKGYQSLTRRDTRSRSFSVPRPHDNVSTQYELVQSKSERKNGSLSHDNSEYSNVFNAPSNTKHRRDQQEQHSDIKQIEIKAEPVSPENFGSQEFLDLKRKLLPISSCSDGSTSSSDSYSKYKKRKHKNKRTKKSKKRRKKNINSQ